MTSFSVYSISKERRISTFGPNSIAKKQPDGTYIYVKFRCIYPWTKNLLFFRPGTKSLLFSRILRKNRVVQKKLYKIWVKISFHGGVVARRRSSIFPNTMFNLILIIRFFFIKKYEASKKSTTRAQLADSASTGLSNVLKWFQ